MKLESSPWNLLVSHLLEELCKLADFRNDVAKCGTLGEQDVFVGLIANA